MQAYVIDSTTTYCFDYCKDEAAAMQCRADIFNIFPS